MLTDKALKALKPSGSIYEVADGFGLSVRVSRTGVKTFQYRYRIDGKPERLTLGHYPDTSLAKAREGHKKARELVDQGISPIRHRQEQRERKERDRREAAGADTVEGLAQEFMARYVARERKRPENVRQMLEADILPRLGKMKAKEVTRRDVIHMLDRIVDRGARVQANRTAATVKQMFQFAVERGIVDSNPCSDIRRQSVGGTEKARERSLTAQEIRALWTGLDRLSAAPTARVKPAPGRKVPPEQRKSAWLSRPLAVALKLLLVTGQRRGELVKARWEHIDFPSRTWKVPAEHSKNGRSHLVPLSTTAVELFRELRALAGGSSFVLPSVRTDSHGQHSEQHITERALTKAAERVQGAISGDDLGGSAIAHWTPHDLRRTFATHVSELGVLPHVVEKLLNHTMQGVMAVYNRHDYYGDRRQAMDTWAARLTGILLEERAQPSALLP